jgi:ApaG protein
LIDDKRFSGFRLRQGYGGQARFPVPGSRHNREVSDTTTDGIRVRVATMFLASESSPRDRRYVFAYRIRISNEGGETAQLISRHWIITNADGETEEVAGPGVVGNQPVLEPGQSFEYTSFCPLPTSMGTMHGTYTMVRPDGSSFEARIAPFTLAAPFALN